MNILQLFCSNLIFITKLRISRKLPFSPISDLKNSSERFEPSWKDLCLPLYSYKSKKDKLVWSTAFLFLETVKCRRKRDSNDILRARKRCSNSFRYNFDDLSISIALKVKLWEYPCQKSSWFSVIKAKYWYVTEKTTRGARLVRLLAHFIQF